MKRQEQFSKAIHRQSSMLLDNIGIHITFSDMPSHSAYQFWKHKRYGYNWLSAMWCQHIRRWLFPNKHQEIVRLFSVAQTQIQQELISAILTQGEEMIKP